MLFRRFFLEQFRLPVCSEGISSKGTIGLYDPMAGDIGSEGIAMKSLTGLIGGLLARGYDSATAAMMGVWIHGYAGDCCSAKYGM